MADDEREFNQRVSTIGGAHLGWVCGRCGGSAKDGHVEGCGRAALFEWKSKQERE